MKFLKITGIVLGVALTLLFLLPELFPGFVARKIKAFANQSIEGKLEFRKARLSVIRHFPSLTLSLVDFSLTGSAPFAADTLLAGKELALGIDLRTLFSERLSVNQFFLTDALVNIQVDSLGKANYNVVKDNADAPPGPADTTEGATLRIERIIIKNSRLVYNDQSLPMLLTVKSLDYTGVGDLTKDVVDLESEIAGTDVSFTYDGEAYAQDKEVEAELITRINTRSLELSFTRNDLRVNQLPLDFTGFIRFPETGYDVDLRFNSRNATLQQLITVLPPAYLKWLDHTSVAGKARIKLVLAGSYRADTHEEPDLDFEMDIDEGMIKHGNAPVAISNLLTRFELSMPQLNADSLRLHLDTLDFKLGSGFVRGGFVVQGLHNPAIAANLAASADLALLQQAAGLTGLQVKGLLNAALSTNGRLQYGPRQGRHASKAEVLTALPATRLQASLTNGYFKMDSLPLAAENISLNFTGNHPGGAPLQGTMQLSNLMVQLGKGFAKGFVQVQPGDKLPINANLQASLDMQDIVKCLPLPKGYILGGQLQLNATAKGNYNPAQKQLPVLAGSLLWQNGKVQTPYYAGGIEKLNLDLELNNNAGNYKSMEVVLKPVEFSFDGEPFVIKADLRNLDNLQYDISSQGTLNLGNLAKAFLPAAYGVNLTGKLQTNLQLQGNMADAQAGRFSRLQHSGYIKADEVALYSEFFPYPFIIKQGHFALQNDRMQATNLQLQYAGNQLKANGYYRNLLAYLMGTGSLEAGIDLYSKQLRADDFMTNAQGTPAGEPATAANTPEAGVIWLPDNLDITAKARVDDLRYGSWKIEQVEGELLIKKGALSLQNAGAKLAGARALLQAGYKPEKVNRAAFNLQVKADSFDVQRFYREVPLFAQMAPAAAKAKGMASLEYALQGRLNGQMAPVLPSIQGKGALNLHEVQMMGFKLFGAVSRATGKDSINNPNLKQVTLKSTIANNLMTIERTKMRVFGFRPRVEGQVSLDGKLNLKFRLGLPPFGLIGIPMTVTGTADNPIVQMRRGKSGDELEEEAEAEDE